MSADELDLDALDDAVDLGRKERRGEGYHPASPARRIADTLAAMDGLDRTSRYVEAIRVGKLMEEAGEAMQALIAYHHVNPRKPAGTLADVIKELCDVALTAKVAIESFGFDADREVARRESDVLDRLNAAREGAR